MPPTTDLEALIRQLAGRGIPGPDGVAPGVRSRSQQIEDDPVLAEIRRRTRVLLGDASEPPPTGMPSHDRITANFISPTFGTRLGRRRADLAWVLAGFGSMAVLGLLCGLVWWLVDRSVTARSQNQTTRLVAEIRAGLAGQPAWIPADPATVRSIQETQSAVEHLAAELAAIDAKLAALGRAGPPVAVVEARPVAKLAGKLGSAPGQPGGGSDPTLATISADLTAIRRELTDSEAATARQIQEMKTVLAEVNNVVRRVLSRPVNNNANNANVALPLAAVAVQALINNLQHPTVQIRGDAVQQLIRLGPLARSALPALQHMVTREPDPNVRSAVESAITVISSN